MASCKSVSKNTKNRNSPSSRGTHVRSEAKRAETEECFSGRLKIYASAHPDNPPGKAGVAIVLNRQLVDTTGAKATEIIPGRALLIQMKWHRTEIVKILAIYAPNVTETDGTESANFWEKLTEYFITHPTDKPDIMAGDYNLVEDMIDRLPMRNDPSPAIDALDELKTLLRIEDGWRATYPSTKAY